MYKNMTMIQADEMAWNEHDWQLDAQIKITMPSWWNIGWVCTIQLKTDNMAWNTIGN